MYFQADPTKVETVQDVLARAAAKGLLGGIVPEQSKTGKKIKNKKKRAASTTSKPSSPSSQEEPEGGEVNGGLDPAPPSEHEEKEEGDFKEGEENEAGGKDNKTKAEKKKKRKTKRNQKQTKGDTAGLKQPKGQKKKTKRKVYQSQHSKPRRIPRLTLTLMSAEKPSRHLSPITALAHKISGKPEKVLQEDSASTLEKHLSNVHPAPSTPQTASERQKIHLKGVEGVIQRQRVCSGNVRKTHGVLKAADQILPPISSPVLSRPQSLTSSPQLASSSSVSLREL